MASTVTVQPQNRRKVCYYYDDDIGNYFYGEGHLMKPHRIRMTHNLILNYGIYRFMKILSPRKTTSMEMTKFHADCYIKLLRVITPANVTKYAKKMQHFSVGGDCPVFEGLYEFCQLSSGGSIAAAAQLNKKTSDICINWSGGLHHAKKARASGFCYVNDVVLAILELLKCHQRVLYVDVDVHHGDGVEEAFYKTNRVMTVSFHKFGEEYFPGTGALNDIGAGKGKYYAINVPLNDGMDDESYESVFVPIMTRVMDTFQPNAVVLQCGADSLTGDRLGCFNLTIHGHGKCVEFIKKYNLPLLMLGGGGYTLKNVARLWTYETSIALGVEIVNDIPYNDYLEYYGPDYKLHSRPNNMTNENTKKYLQEVKERVFENIRMLPHAPGVQMQNIFMYNLFDDSDDEDNKDKDERLSQKDRDSRIAFNNELSDSEDDGEDGRRDQISHKEKFNDQNRKNQVRDNMMKYKIGNLDLKLEKDEPELNESVSRFSTEDRIVFGISEVLNEERDDKAKIVFKLEELKNEADIKEQKEGSNVVKIESFDSNGVKVEKETGEDNTTDSIALNEDQNQQKMYK